MLDSSLLQKYNTPEDPATSCVFGTAKSCNLLAPFGIRVQIKSGSLYLISHDDVAEYGVQRSDERPVFASHAHRAVDMMPPSGPKQIYTNGRLQGVDSLPYEAGATLDRMI